LTAQDTQEGAELGSWDPARVARRIEPIEARLSRGFFRCKPEGWFPGLNAQWFTLAHSIGVELKVQEVRPLPVSQVPQGPIYGGLMDSDLLGLVFEKGAKEILGEIALPDSPQKSHDLVVEYLARRFLATLSQCWSGPKDEPFQYHSNVESLQVRAFGAVKLVALVNGRPITLWVVLGARLVERIDGLWRRQVQMKSRNTFGEGAIHIEIAQLAVPPSLLSEYVKAGTVIDTQVPLSDTVILRVGVRPWLLARLCILSGNWAFEAISSNVPVPGIPEGTTRLSIELGQLGMNPVLYAECGQVGSVLETNIPATNRVNLVINGEKVGEGTLCTYKGGYALSVG
jgi:hypothetical protein